MSRNSINQNLRKLPGREARIQARTQEETQALMAMMNNRWKKDSESVNHTFSSVLYSQYPAPVAQKNTMKSRKHRNNKHRSHG